LHDQVVRYTQRVAELQLQPRGVIQDRCDVLLQRLQAAGSSQASALFFVWFRKGALRQPGGNREELRSIP
jgi:hypothetical protein